MVREPEKFSTCAVFLNIIALLGIIVINCLCVICLFWTLSHSENLTHLQKRVGTFVDVHSDGDCRWDYVKGECSEGCLYLFRAGDFTFGHSCRSPDAQQTTFDLFVLYFLVWISGLVMLCTMLKVTYDSVRGGGCNVCMADTICAYEACQMAEAACTTPTKSGKKRSRIYNASPVGVLKKKYTQTVLITGGSGTLGGALIQEISTNYPDFRIVVFDILPVKELHYDFIQITGNLTNLADVEEALATYRPDIILHFAAIIPAINSKKQLIYDVNVRGTLNLLQFAKQNGTKKFIISSSVSVLISNEKRNFFNLTSKAQYAPQFIDCYAETKALSEQFVLMANDPENEFYTTVLRLPALVGWGDEHWCMASIKKTFVGRCICGFGETLLEFLEVKNGAYGFMKAAMQLESPKVHGKVFNLGGEKVFHGDMRANLLPGCFKFYFPWPCFFVLAHLNEWIFYLSRGYLWLERQASVPSYYYAWHGFTFDNKEVIEAFGYHPTKYGTIKDIFNNEHKPRWEATHSKGLKVD